jgi:hypothetical protein
MNKQGHYTPLYTGGQLNVREALDRLRYWTTKPSVADRPHARAAVRTLLDLLKRHFDSTEGE